MDANQVVSEKLVTFKNIKVIFSTFAFCFLLFALVSLNQIFSFSSISQEMQEKNAQLLSLTRELAANHEQQVEFNT